MRTRNFAMQETSLKALKSTPLRSLTVMHAFTSSCTHTHPLPSPGHLPHYEHECSECGGTQEREWDSRSASSLFSLCRCSLCLQLSW